MARVSAMLLAAGESSRMGTQKALLPWAGTTLIAYQLAQLAAVDDVAEIIVVTGHEPERIVEAVECAPRARCMHNDAYRTGKVSSILCGLQAVSPDAGAILLLAVDQPRPAPIMRTLIAALVDAGALITAPIREGHRGHPLIFSRALLPELMAISEEMQGVRDVVRRHADAVQDVEIDDPAIHLDLNTPADVERGLAG
jgi:molybdenum cofactor cytidylyltransferase